MDFEAVFRLLIENFQKGKVRFALIGGFGRGPELEKILEKINC